MRYKSLLLGLGLAFSVPFLMGAEGGCDHKPSSDDIQREQQERILKEGTSVVGMPAIINFRERKLLKEIFEKRDMANFQTYTYVENMVPTIVKGWTTHGGKFTFFCESVGYPIPYATQLTNPQKLVSPYSAHWLTLPQADPNGLFTPASADGTWVVCKDPDPKSKRVEPIHVESKVTGSPFRFPLDQ